jgi:hypothetical protein
VVGAAGCLLPSHQPAPNFISPKLFKIILRSYRICAGFSRFAGVRRSSNGRTNGCSAPHTSAMDDSTEIKDTRQKDPVQKRREKAPRVQKPRVRKAPPPALPVREIFPYPYTKFELISSLESEGDAYGKFRSRLGTLILRRSSSSSLGNTSKNDEDAQLDGTRIVIQTPAMICGARRGMVKHLSRDNVTLAKGVEWIHVPLEDL